MLRNIRKKIQLFPVRASVWLIRAYQVLLSPDHSWLRARHPYGYCRFYPSCSQYAKQALVQYGFISGWLLTLKRLSRCHPWAEPRVDLVPKI